MQGFQKIGFIAILGKSAFQLLARCTLSLSFSLVACSSVHQAPKSPEITENPVISTPNSIPNTSKLPTEHAQAAIEKGAFSPTSPSPIHLQNLPAPIIQSKSRWLAVQWSDLPGWSNENLSDVWAAWARNCERVQAIPASLAKLCPEMQLQSKTSISERKDWLQEKFQPYRVENLEGKSEGLLTAYYEPVLEASRLPNAKFRFPLWQAPSNLHLRKPWFSRKEIDTLPEAQNALKGREIAYLADPIDALILQIQGSGKLHISEPNGSKRMVRAAFAGTNEQPYRSVGRWLLDQKLIQDASWPGIKAWIAKSSPTQMQEMLWSNPRMVFFKEEMLTPESALAGPRGALGVPLTAGRSIAVDRASIPLGTPLWLSSQSETFSTQSIVFAQDVGSAILGAVRADYYVGSGVSAGELAGRLKQSLQLWVLWPK